MLRLLMSIFIAGELDCKMALNVAAALYPLMLTFILESLGMTAMVVLNHHLANSHYLQEKSSRLAKVLLGVSAGWGLGFLLVMLIMLLCPYLAPEALKILASLLIFCAFGFLSASYGYESCRFPDDKELFRLRSLGVSLNPRRPGVRLLYWIFYLGCLLLCLCLLCF